MPEDAAAPLLEVREIWKSFAGVQALRGASLSLRGAEVHALVGENGAGKSTLIKALAGIERPDACDLRVDGAAVRVASGADAARLRFSFIHQELNLVPYFDACENVFLGRRYPCGLAGLIDRRALERRAAASLAELGVELPLRVPVSRLSRGQQAMVAIARAFVDEARLYVMDEPTASLADEEIRALFAVVRRLKARGAAVLYVSHRLEEIFELCDRLTVMRDGQTVAALDVAATDPRSVIRLLIGRSLSDPFPPPLAPPGSEELLAVDGLRCGRGPPVSFTLRAGEILGMAGLVGSGRSTLLGALGGRVRTLGGKVRLGGRPYAPARPRDAIAAGVFLVPEERRREGLVLTRSIAENIALPNLSAFSRLGLFLDRRLEAAAAGTAAARVSLKLASLRQAAGSLSGGNQQKVVFAKWIPREARVLLLDEPSRGVDVGARYEIHKIVRELAARGAGVILSSSDLSEVMGLADRVLVLRQGRVEAILDARGLERETVLGHCFGHGRG
jgi:ABC-type sugar transport system ATPase subunit